MAKIRLQFDNSSGITAIKVSEGVYLIQTQGVGGSAGGGGGGGAPTDAEYLVGAANASLTAERVKASIYDNYDPNDYPTSPNALDDEFEGSGAIDGKWTKVNDPAGVDAMNQTSFPGYLYCGLPERVSGIYTLTTIPRLRQTAPAGNAAATYIARVNMAVQGLGGDIGEYAGVGICLWNSTDNEMIGIATITTNYTEANLTGIVQPHKDDGAGVLGTFSGTTSPRVYTVSQPVWVKLEKPGADAYTSANVYNVYFSVDGIVWQQVGTETKTFTHDCDQVGIYFLDPLPQTGTPHGDAIVDLFRRTV